MNLDVSRVTEFPEFPNNYQAWFQLNRQSLDNMNYYALFEKSPKIVTRWSFWNCILKYFHRNFGTKCAVLKNACSSRTCVCFGCSELLDPSFLPHHMCGPMCVLVVQSYLILPFSLILPSFAMTTFCGDDIMERVRDMLCSIGCRWTRTCQLRRWESWQPRWCMIHKFTRYVVVLRVWAKWECLV
jgi:hypothetical protein